jgi:choline monooxygenase
MSEHNSRRIYFTDEEIHNVRKSLDEASVIPTLCYRDEEYHQKEIDQVLMRSWLPVGRTDQLVDVGDYFTRNFFGESVVIVKGKDNQVRALSNVCRHRATQIVDDGVGNKKLLTCPYHKWVYNLDGGLRGAPQMDMAKEFDRKGCRLPEFRLEIWNGFIFVNFDSKAAPLASELEPLTKALAPYDMASLKTIPFRRLSCDWNWKASMENFTEAYHHIGIHTETVEPFMPAAEVRYEDSNNAYSLFWMPTKDKKPMPSSLPDIPGLPDEYYYSKAVANVYPFLHLLIGSNIILWLDFDVKAVNQHDLVWSLLVPETTLELPDFEDRLAPWKERMEGVITEDIYACTKADIGQQSRFFTPGRYCHMEKSVYQMHNWLVDAMDTG